MIELKNIDLSKVEPADQMRKFDEEYEEFIESVVDHSYGKDKSNEHMIEEFYDLLQAGLGLLTFEGVYADEVMAGYPRHLEKLKHRPRD